MDPKINSLVETKLIRTGPHYEACLDVVSKDSVVTSFDVIERLLPFICVLFGLIPVCVVFGIPVKVHYAVTHLHYAVM